MPNYEAMDEIFKKFGKRVLVMKLMFFRQGKKSRFWSEFLLKRFEKLYLFGPAFICIGDLDTYKKVGSSPRWANRWKEGHYTTAATFNKPMGIISANGEYWRQNRNFVIKMLTELEFYNVTNLENSVRTEFHQLEKRIRSELKENGEILAVAHLFQLASANVVFQVILGRRYNADEPRIRRLISVMNRMNETINLGAGILELIPSLRHVPKLTFMDDIQDFSKCFYEFVEVIQAASKSYSVVLPGWRTTKFLGFFAGRSSPKEAAERCLSERAARSCRLLSFGDR